jgi:hypothetical protein
MVKIGSLYSYSISSFVAQQKNIETVFRFAMFRVAAKLKNSNQTCVQTVQTSSKHLTQVTMELVRSTPAEHGASDLLL